MMETGMYGMMGYGWFGMSLYGLAYFALAAFIFGVIFWWTYKLVMGDKKK